MESAAADFYQRAVDRLPACRVLVAGDVMLDRYWFGRVDRVSPEAPVPVIAVDASEERLGGAGNVAGNIAALGGKSTLLSVVGADEAGRKVAEIAARLRVDSQLVVDRAFQTTIKLRMMSRNQQLLRADFESFPGGPALKDAADKFAGLLEHHQAVVLSDYGKGGLNQIETLIDLAAKKNIPVLVDPKGGNFSRYRGAAMVTPNLKEFERVAGTVRDDADMRAKANHLMQAHDLNQLLVTLSNRGMALFSRERDTLRRDARAKEIYDVSGAGDSVIAVMAMAMATGLDDHAAVSLANSAAGVVVSKLGTSTADLDELRAAVGRDYPR